MANSLIATTFKTPVITASSERLNHPASNLGAFAKWRRTWRSVTTGTETIVFDFGATTTLSGVFLNHANFSLMLVEASANASSWTAVDLISVAKDPRVGRRKVWDAASTWTPAFNHRYLRLTPSTIDAPNPGYFELGAVAFPETAEMVNNWSVPLDWSPVRAITDSPVPGGGIESNIEGPVRLRYDLRVQIRSPAAMTQLQALNLRRPAPVFLHENRGDFSAAYILTQLQEVRFPEQFRITESGPWTWEETL